MPVYIDDTRIPYRGFIMSHMVADTLDELHDMAELAGLKLSWFQDGKFPHYDICQSRKKIAISQGAIRITAKELITILKKKE